MDRSSPVLAAMRRWPRWARLALGVAVFLVVIAAVTELSDDDAEVGAGQGGQPASTQASVSLVPAQSTDPAAGRAPESLSPLEVTRTTPPAVATMGSASPRTEFGDGNHRVGIDIVPGAYIAQGGARCYWERRSVYDRGGSETILANEYQPEPAVVTIAVTDEGFLADGCGTWRRS